MTETEDEMDRRIDALSALVGLPIAPEHRPGVRQFLAIAAEMEAALAGADLDPDELALTPVYAPPALESGEGGA